MGDTRCLKPKWPGSILDNCIIVLMKCISDKKYMKCISAKIHEICTWKET